MAAWNIPVVLYTKVVKLLSYIYIYICTIIIVYCVVYTARAFILLVYTFSNGDIVQTDLWPLAVRTYIYKHFTHINTLVVILILRICFFVDVLRPV